MTKAERDAIVSRMVRLAAQIAFNGDQKNATKNKDEQAFWQARIDEKKEDFMVFIRQLFPAYTGTVEQFVAHNAKLLAQGIN